MNARSLLRRNAAHRRVTPEPLNVAPQLIGLPLAAPARRALAMGVDLAVVALLTGVSGLWLLAGLAGVTLQLRNRPRTAPDGRRTVVGWVAAGFIALLALQAAKTQWSEWRHPAAAAAAALADKADAGDVADLKEARDAALAAGPAASAAVAALDAALALAPASAAASAPPVTDAQRIAKLQAELAQ